MFYLCEFRPFNEKILNYSNLFAEFGICVFFSVYTLLLFDIGEKGKAQVDYTLLITLNGIMGVQMAASILIFSKTIYEKIRHKKKQDQVAPDQPVQLGPQGLQGLQMQNSAKSSPEGSLNRSYNIQEQDTFITHHPGQQPIRNFRKLY